MKTKYIKQIIFGAAILSLCPYIKAQTNHAAAKPFLKATQDARGMALAGSNAATSADAYSIYSNASKSVLSDKVFEIGAGFSQFRPTLSKDLKLYSVAGYYNIGYKSSILAGFRYSKGVSIEPGFINTIKFAPYEYSIDLGYAYSPIDNLSFAIVGSYSGSQILSDINHKDLLVGFGATYRYSISSNYKWTTGLNISNIGFNLDSEKSEYSLPTSVVWGNSINANIIPNHNLSFSVDLISHLLPKESKSVEGAFAIEYTAFDLISLRGGYRLADEEKGSYSYFTSGLGVKFRGVSFDATYILAGKDTPMQNAWWITASFAL